MGDDVRILAGPGHSLLMTNLGPLDVLGAIEGGGLETIIELKRGSTRVKDQLVLSVLEETLRRGA